MSQHRPVPRLDLAPKLKRPLSLWNPLDYLRLLYWVFFFPQALRWYVDRFGGGYIPEREMNWDKGWELLRQNAVQRQLLFQGLVLTVFTPVAVGVILQEIQVPINWFRVALGVALGVMWGVMWGVMSGVMSGAFDWQLVRFASASLNETLKSKFVKGFFSPPVFFFLPRRWKEQLQARFKTDIRLDTPARATAAGFWYLHEKEPAKAMEAFAVVRSLLYGEEMFILAQTLATFHAAKELATVAAIQLPAFPKEPLLRPITWKAITSLCRVVEDIQLVQRSASRSTRSFALNRAQGELKSILDTANFLPQAERELIEDIAKTWQNALLQVAGEVGEVSITKPVINP
ncbi:hypothetical protein MiSe_01840 [Microseira wollei NIES-4236]|uniref:DUF4013 domain-containing protein n=1 Tax=Microseira wollei NIES-4236 TaxID=2530354 RepID=A0AAV3X7U7_9CYAN|nr:hypothetical protein [Microseira wollei]GET35442.1 hypothetical protein MiSe_01840 [Microseira wollei NIES-4236]